MVQGRLCLKLNEKQLQATGDKETYMGVYALMEHVKGDYVKHRQDLFGGKGGHLWKARSGASLRDPNAWMGADDNENDYTYELKTNKKDFETAQAELQTFIRNLNNLTGNEFYSWAEKTMDVPLLLRTYAVNVFHSLRLRQYPGDLPGYGKSK